MKCVIDQKRESETPVCDGCRRRVAEELRALVDAYALLVVVEDLDGGKDPVSQTLPAGTVRSGSRGAPVTGSREAPVPVNLDIIDLTWPARSAECIIDPYRDQIGFVPVATILDAWVRDWLDVRDRGEHLPVPTVVTLVDWLSKRLDWACDEHPAIDEFVREIRQSLRTCQRLAGDAPVRPTVLDGVPCATPECDGILLHRPGDDYWAECALCGRLWREDEYRNWTRLLAAHVRPERAA